MKQFYVLLKFGPKDIPYIGVAGGGGGGGGGGGQGGPPPNGNFTNDKNDDTKPIVSCVSVCFSIFCLQQYTRTTAIGNNNNIDNQGGPFPLNLNFCQSI